MKTINGLDRDAMLSALAASYLTAFAASDEDMTTHLKNLKHTLKRDEDDRISGVNMAVKIIAAFLVHHGENITMGDVLVKVIERMGNIDTVVKDYCEATATVAHRDGNHEIAEEITADGAELRHSWNRDDD